MIHPLRRLLILLLLPLLLTPALAPAAHAQGRPEVAGNWLVRVAGPQPFTMTLSVDEHGGVLTPRALSRQQTIFPGAAARTDSGFVVNATAWERENTLDVAVRGDSLRGSWSTAGQAPIPASGIRLPRETLAPLTGTAVFDSVVRVLERHFYDPGYNGADWARLVADARPRIAAARSDGEAYAVISGLLRAIGTSHLNFTAVPRVPSPAPVTPPAASAPAASAPAVSWQVLSPSLGYLRIASFEPSGESLPPEVARLDSAFAAFAGLPAIVIDLRGNEGGSVDLAYRLGQHLHAAPVAAGYLVVRRGFDARGMRTAAALDPATVPTLPADLPGALLADAVEAAGGAGMLSMGGGLARTYTGRVAILIDGNTGSAAEATAAMLRETRGAVTVGARTEGAMLSSADVMVAPGWRLRYPAMDFRTAAGVRLEGDGVPLDVPADPADRAALLRAAAEALRVPTP
ncbi:S41 family peptidase [Longimicrobium sp.]|uniref:S41 family peptidase n=1 Tax=Longimicrobium sp. TaxID=2029185 RepID=UPI002E375690|nr:S41 family peptidase [Longimicrobium sp.]HEX6037684.1 S41 family peptidase [Longimicrobium sp.]